MKLVLALTFALIAAVNVCAAVVLVVVWPVAVVAVTTASAVGCLVAWRRGCA